MKIKLFSTTMVFMIGRNDPCWCRSGKKWKKCHFPQENPSKEIDLVAERYKKQYQILIKSDEEIEKIRAACVLASNILEATAARAQAGVTTAELDAYAHELHEKAGAIPAALHYGSPPFPKSICISLNEIICHGIPSGRPLVEGDIANIDVACILDGYYGDCSRMVAIGKVSEERRLVTDVAYECLMRSIEILKPGVLVSEIGDTIEAYADSQNCSVVYQFVGHGVGIHFHEGPQVPHCANRLNIPLVAGMTFTIEPMINAGVPEAVIDPANHWEARTKDGRASAQWEHTILITDTGHEILTTWKR